MIRHFGKRICAEASPQRLNGNTATLPQDQTRSPAGTELACSGPPSSNAIFFPRAAEIMRQRWANGWRPPPRSPLSDEAKARMSASAKVRWAKWRARKAAETSL